MTSENAPPVEPVPTDYAGQSFGRTARRLFHATRPKFFPASALPVLAGTAWGVQATGQFDGIMFVLALLATVCVHAGSNVLNDVGDEINGTDRRNSNRIYPYTGGSRFIQAGILDKSSMARLGGSLLLVASIAGVMLVMVKGPMVLLFGISGLVLGVIYSLGPVRLNSIGLGETAVAIAFGILPVTGAAWLQEAVIDAHLLLYALPISAWVAAILLINEVPDIEADAVSGKRTLPVRLGLGGTATLYIMIHVAGVAAVVGLTAMGRLPLVSTLLPAALLILVFRAAAAIRNGLEDRPRLTKAIESTLAIHTLGSLWLIMCLLFRLWWPTV